MVQWPGPDTALISDNHSESPMDDGSCRIPGCVLIFFLLNPGFTNRVLYKTASIPLVIMPSKHPGTTER